MAAANKPFYSEQELFNHIKEFFVDFKVTLNDIKNPSQPFVMEFYERVLMEFDIDVDTVLQPQMCQTAKLLHPEAYTDIISIRNLVCAINSFNIFKTYQGFRLTDLLNPKPRRNLILMSAMMNFVIFCDNRLSAIKDKLNKVEEMQKERDNLLTLRNELKEAIQNQAIGRAQKDIQIKELSKECARLSEEQASIMKRKQEFRLIQEDVKSKLAGAEHNLKKAKQQEMKLLQELGEIQDLIVESPKQVIAEFKTLQKKAEEIKEKKETMQNLIETKKQTSEKLSNELKAQKERNAELKEIIDLIRKTRKAESELEKTNKRCAEIKEKNTDVTRECNELKDLVASSQQQLETLESEAQSLENAVKTTAKENEDLEKTGSNSSDVQNKINELDLTIEGRKAAFQSLLDISNTMYKERIIKEKESNPALIKELYEIAESVKLKNDIE